MKQHTIPVQIRWTEGLLRIQAKPVKTQDSNNREYGFGGVFTLGNGSFQYIKFRDWFNVQTHSLPSLSMIPQFDEAGLHKTDHEGNAVFLPANSKYVPGEAYVIKGPSGHVVVRVFGAKFNRSYGAAVRLRHPKGLRNFINANKE